MNEKIRPRTEQSRKRRSIQARKRRKRNLRIKVSLFIILIAAVIVGAFLMKKYGPSKEEADLNAYYGIEQEDQLAIVIDNKIEKAGAIEIDGRPYVEYTIVRDSLNERFYLDFHENILLYTLPDGTIRADVGSTEYTYQKEKHTEEYVIFKMDGNTAYIALDFVQKYTNIEFQTYEDPKRVVIQSEWGEIQTAVIRKETQIRCENHVKSAILTFAEKKEKVTIVQQAEEWSAIRTKDGFIGYIKSKYLKDIGTETTSRAFTEQIYSNISKDYTINMAWHVVTDENSNGALLEMVADTKGLTTVSPTWFMVADTEGNLNSLANAQYVNYAHQLNLEVWALVKDFDGGIGSREETYELLSHTEHRENLINQLLAEVLRNDIDGINVDFEQVSSECGEHYLQFLRELSLKCRQNGIILSVDNYVPAAHNVHYNLEEQGKIVDYVIIMGYDEYYSGSYESGPVASLNYVKSGIENALKAVPKEKLINAVPFYTRLWEEVEKTEAELEAEAGTEAANYPMKVSCRAYGMDAAKQIIADAEAEITVDQSTGLNYAEWKYNDVTYRIWLEDETALEDKLKLMKEYELAGVSAWRLGFESDEAWDLILKYVN